MKLKVLVLLLLVGAVACKHHKEQQLITIEGHIKNVPDGKIYLADSKKWRTPIDSTTIKNGHFVFTEKLNDAFTPFLAAIHFVDSNKVKRLIYRNYTLGKDSMRFFTDAFYLEPGKVFIEGDNNQPPFLRIFAGKENDLLFKNQFVDFGWIANLDSAQKIKKIESFENTIRQNPFSFFLLESIYASREQYTKKQLQKIFSLFTGKVRHSAPGIKFQNYLELRPDDTAPLPNLTLATPEGNKIEIIDSGSKINMLIFWASWCTPCRKEVPDLKILSRQFNHKGLRMISISIDQSKKNWVQALTADSMAWPQVHVPYNQLEKIQNQFRFSAIPLVIFTDHNGRETKRVAHYDSGNLKLYQHFIREYLQK